MWWTYEKLLTFHVARKKGHLTNINHLKERGNLFINFTSHTFIFYFFLYLWTAKVASASVISQWN